jgi:hypothetical protein
MVCCLLLPALPRTSDIPITLTVPTFPIKRVWKASHDQPERCSFARHYGPYHQFSGACTWVPDEFLLTVLTMKMRHITVYRNLALRANVFLDSKLCSESLPPETRSLVLSLLTGGEKTSAIYEEQLDQANRLMDYIDDHDPKYLRTLLSPNLLLLNPTKAWTV